MGVAEESGRPDGSGGRSGGGIRIFLRTPMLAKLSMRDEPGRNMVTKRPLAWHRINCVSTDEGLAVTEAHIFAPGNECAPSWSLTQSSKRPSLSWQQSCRFVQVTKSTMVPSVPRSSESHGEGSERLVWQTDSKLSSTHRVAAKLSSGGALKNSPPLLPYVELNVAAPMDWTMRELIGGASEGTDGEGPGGYDVGGGEGAGDGKPN